jgi:hypothetical protein
MTLSRIPWSEPGAPPGIEPGDPMTPQSTDGASE